MNKCCANAVSKRGAWPSGEQTYKHDCGEEEGEGGKCGESHMETHIIICRTDSKWEFAV